MFLCLIKSKKRNLNNSNSTRSVVEKKLFTKEISGYDMHKKSLNTIYDVVVRSKKLNTTIYCHFL